MESAAAITTVGTLEDAGTLENGVHSVTIFANSASRDGHVVEPTGMDFSAYRKNPVVLYAHDLTGRTQSAGLPIGRTRRLVRMSDGRIRAEFEFLPGDAFADRVRNAWRRGFLRAASMGWRAVESRPSGGGVIITKSELLEWSIVAVPADPDALRDAHSRVMRSLLNANAREGGGDDGGEEVIFENPSGAGETPASATPDMSDAKRRLAELASWIRANPPAPDGGGESG